ncbi:MAG: histidinol-phosphate transaminase [Peptococcaceae bacterium]|nr:histidinol-phosphate transaminase [Peptococcaceae bacterium]
MTNFIKKAANDFIRPVLTSLQAYQPSEDTGKIRMDANENPFPWPEGMQEEVFNSTLEFNRYPDGSAKALRQGIATYNNVDWTEVLVGNGSDELIQLILSTFAGPGSSLIVHPPTFSMYWAAATITGTSVEEVPLLGGISLDTEGIIKSSQQAARSVMIICNPNNPTGNAFARSEILQIVRESPGLVVVDEAYYEFSGETLADVINEYPNLLILRTFSKAFGLAALRVGYVLANKTLIADLNKVRQPYNVNSFSQQAAAIALKYLPAYLQQVAILKKEIQKISEELGQLPGVTVYPTAANFVLFRPADCRTWAEEFAAKGFNTRYFTNLPVLKEAIRVSSALPEQNQEFLRIATKLAGV